MTPTSVQPRQSNSRSASAGWAGSPERSASPSTRSPSAPNAAGSWVYPSLDDPASPAPSVSELTIGFYDYLAKALTVLQSLVSAGRLAHRQHLADPHLERAVPDAFERVVDLAGRRHRRAEHAELVPEDPVDVRLGRVAGRRAAGDQPTALREAGKRVGPRVGAGFRSKGDAERPTAAQAVSGSRPKRRSWSTFSSATPGVTCETAAMTTKRRPTGRPRTPPTNWTRTRSAPRS